MSRGSTTLLLALAISAAGCQKPDVGARCTIGWSQSTPAPTPQTAAGDFFETGNIGCDDLICIVSPAPASSRYGGCSGTACGYCSKPCVSDQDCFKSDTGLVCAQVVLDPGFLASLDPALASRYLGDIRFSSYCVVPRQ